MMKFKVIAAALALTLISSVAYAQQAPPQSPSAAKTPAAAATGQKTETAPGKSESPNTTRTTTAESTTTPAPPPATTTAATDQPPAAATTNAAPTPEPVTVTPVEAGDTQPPFAAEEEEAVQPYYKNFFSTYRLGPEDVISVSVFGQERYSKVGIQIPPNGRISYPLIPEGVHVAGKTVEQVQAELIKKLDEYIIDPKITVSLDQSRSTRYAVLGDVGAPGVKPMLRRLTVMEALAEAGGVTSSGSKKNVKLLRRQAGGQMTLIAVNVSAIEKGRAPDNVYLIPGDQIIVPGNRIKKVQQVLGWVSLISFANFFRF